jgi:signal transduction histidine kinase
MVQVLPTTDESVIAPGTGASAVAVEIPDAARILSGSSLSKLGHELRGPLGGIMSLTALMRRKLAQGPVATEQQSRQLGMMSDSAAGLLAMVERVVALARLDETDLEPWVEPADCGAVVTRVVAELADAARTRDRRVHVDVSDEPVLAAAAAPVVSSIVTELLDNAIKYACFADIDIRVCYTPDTQQPAISVRDHGPGLTDDDKQRIFLPFERGAASQERAEFGTGLGLCLAQRSAVRHGGSLSAVSGPSGTAVTVMLLAA